MGTRASGIIYPRVRSSMGKTTSLLCSWMQLLPRGGGTKVVVYVFLSYSFSLSSTHPFFPPSFLFYYLQIYRHVWLNIADALHVAPWGVYAPSYVTGPIVDSGAGQSTTEAVVYPVPLSSLYLLYLHLLLYTSSPLTYKRKVQTTVMNDYGVYTDFLVTTAVMQGTVILAQVSSQGISFSFFSLSFFYALIIFISHIYQPR